MIKKPVSLKSCSIAAALVVVCTFVPAARTEGQSIPATLETAEWRHIGPAAFGGRISDLAVDPTNSAVIYVGAAAGGVFKSINSGTTWRPVFDKSGGAQSIGAIAIAPSDPQVIWVGTGEANNRQSSSWGNGVYRSVDGGATWTALGLADTHHIGRIVVHPRNPDIAYVAALGHLWGPNEARGVYRTRDGGKSWQKVLSIDAQTGVVDITLDPDGRTLIAGAYPRQRKAYGFVGGGKSGGIFRSVDGGDTWNRLSEGLPSGETGRIGLAQSRSRPEIVYAVIEHKNAGGVYRSEDRGSTWKRMNPLNPRPMYYSQLRVDPTNADRVWMLDAYLFSSIDGGKTFSSDSTGEGIHVDHHAMWIDPSSPGHMVLGNDGGLYVTHDYAKSWRYIDNLPIGQYYDISVDDQDPYLIYGGVQDNGSWALPSRTSRQGGIFNTDIINLATGDGFYTTPDPENPKHVYANSQNGRAYSVNVETGEQRLIRPVPSDTAITHSFGWSTPMLVSPHDPRTYYFGGERLFRTRDRGVTWQPVSQDMSRKTKWKSLPIMGVIRDSTTLSRDDGVSDYGTLTSITESPRRAGILLVGTDEGVVQLSMDSGTTWTDITSRFPLAPKWVSRVLASEHDAKIMYVAFDGHRDDDFRPYLFRTSDEGKTWKSITTGIPAGYVIKSVAEHPDNANVLLAGTEHGLLVTYDGGKVWKRAGGNLPNAPIDDIVVHRSTRDIILGTHGRSLIVLDDTRLMAAGDPATGTTRLIAPGAATMSYSRRALPAAGGARFSGDNAADGVLITYVIGADTRASNTDSASITIRSADSSLIRELKGSSAPGVHRVVWDLRQGLPYTPVTADGVWFGPPKGAWVVPGTYTVTMRVAGLTQTNHVEVRADPRAGASMQDLSARHAAGMKAHEMLRAWNDADGALKKLDAVLATRPANDSVTTAYKAKVADLHERFRSGWLGLKSRVIDLHGAIQSATAAPTEAQARVLGQLQEEMKREVSELNQTILRINGPGSATVSLPE